MLVVMILLCYKFDDGVLRRLKVMNVFTEVMLILKNVG
jgi:hypothetical protein